VKKKSKPPVKTKVLTEEEKQKVYTGFSKLWDIWMGPYMSEMKEVEKYIALDDVYRGRLLNCALVLEHLVDRYMKEKRLSTSDERSPLSGLSFSRKLERLEERADPKFSRNLIDGMMAINTIRNKYAHRLNYDIRKNGSELLARIDHIATESIYPPIKPEQPDYAIRIIEQYTTLASSYIFSRMGKVKTDLDNFKNEYPGSKKLFSMFSEVDIFKNTKSK
jgi:hypothetical protein